MEETKPEDIPAYKKWLEDTLDVHISVLTKINYESASNKILNDFENSVLWETFCSQLDSIGQEYYIANNYPLFLSDDKPQLIEKSFNSMLIKSFRKNVIYNDNWENEPEGGWVLPINWYSKINDIVRSYVVVKYLDGVQFLADKLQLLCHEFDIPITIDFEAKEEGYYAAHTYITFACEIPGEDWDTTQIDAIIELQITTQLQEVIRKLLHKYYEDRRKQLESSELKWQWDYRSDEFAANYLGHILHYVEGMIMEVRTKQEEKSP